jgi:hypothetical protein
LENKDELNATTFQTYVYLIKVGRPVGPRDVMRGASLSSPSVAYRNLQKLMNLGLVVTDQFGNYVAKEKVGLKGYIWIGKSLIPRFTVFGLIFLGVLIAEVSILIPHLFFSSPVEISFWFLTVITVVTALIFLVEGLRFREAKKSQP